jgi:polyisoprenoid-binding protein YceI
MRKIHRHPAMAVALLLCLSALLTGCPRPVRPPSPAPSVPPTAPVDTSGAAIYDVSGENSELDILVFRGGALSRLGHNHVISSRTLSGRASIHPQFPRSGFELTFPVKELTVDDPQRRRAAGGDFPPDIPQADRDGTRKNMLRAEVLDADRFPNITLSAARVAGTLESPHITARITIKETSRDVEVPTKIVLEGRRLTATGELDIQQTDFGIKPFSAALGALEVQDRLHIQFKVVAEKKE